MSRQIRNLRVNDKAYSSFRAQNAPAVSLIISLALGLARKGQHKSRPRYQNYSLSCCLAQQGSLTAPPEPRTGFPRRWLYLEVAEALVHLGAARLTFFASDRVSSGVSTSSRYSTTSLGIKCSTDLATVSLQNVGDVAASAPANLRPLGPALSLTIFGGWGFQPGTFMSWGTVRVPRAG
jgi:hypothetical protein